MFELNSWNTSIFGISGGMPKPTKNLGKMDVFPMFATTMASPVASSYQNIEFPAKKLENIHFWD